MAAVAAAAAASHGVTIAMGVIQDIWKVTAAAAAAAAAQIPKYG